MPCNTDHIATVADPSSAYFFEVRRLANAVGDQSTSITKFCNEMHHSNDARSIANVYYATKKKKKCRCNGRQSITTVLLDHCKYSDG
jgi:hypothetical protein